MKVRITGGAITQTVHIEDVTSIVVFDEQDQPIAAASHQSGCIWVETLQNNPAFVDMLAKLGLTLLEGVKVRKL